MKLHTYITLLAMFLLVVFEVGYSWRKQRHLFTRKETYKSLIIAFGAMGNNFAGKSLSFFAFELIYQYRLFTFGNGWWVWILAFVASDFSFYWFHRAQHHVNWFWASHAVHHSSHDFNLLASLRGPWFTAELSGKIIFWLWTPLLGFNPIMMIIVYEFIKNYQFWVHTETIRKLPAAIEFIFNTPSHHRVHHATNIKYLDKNNGGMLIIWDRIFGSFQEEEEKPVYGLTGKNTSVLNPIQLVFGQWMKLFTNLLSCGSIKHCINYIIQPPGWSHDGSTKTVRQMREEKTDGESICQL